MVVVFAAKGQTGRAIREEKRTVIGTLLDGDPLLGRVRLLGTVRLLLSDLGLADIGQESGVGGAAEGEVLPSLVEAELAIHGQANFRGVFVFLAVVFPPADGAERQSARGL